MTFFRTDVVKVPPTPLGLLEECWKVQHRCATCRRVVRSQDLVAHAHEHDALGLANHRSDTDEVTFDECLEKGDTIG